VTSAAGVTVAAGTDIVSTGALTTKIIGGVIGVAANMGVQQQTEPNKPIDEVDAVAAGVTGFLATGTSLWTSIGINTDGALIGSIIKDENPIPSMGGAIVGTFGGYYVGKVVEAGASKYIQYTNPLATYWTDPASGMARMSPPSNVPALIGNGFSSGTQEGIGYVVKESIQNGLPK
jgi:hypothetical protein